MAQNPYRLGARRMIATYARAIGRDANGKITDRNVAASHDPSVIDVAALGIATRDKTAAIKLNLSREQTANTREIAERETLEILNDGTRLARLQATDDRLASRHWRWTRQAETTITRDPSTRQLRGSEIAGSVRALPRNATDAPGAGCERAPRAFMASETRHMGVIGADTVADWANAASEALTLTRDQVSALASDLITFAHQAKRSEFADLASAFLNAQRVLGPQASETRDRIFSILPGGTSARRDLGKALNHAQARTNARYGWTQNPHATR